MRVLVTGATGFLGRRVARALAKDGHEVLATGRNAALLDAVAPDVADVYAWDLTQPFPQGALQVDAIIHCAALSSAFGARSDFWRANVDATANLIDHARHWGAVRFVYISSPTVYFNNADALNVSEDTPLPQPINHYAETKIEAEQRVFAAADLGPIILRPRGIYGPGDQSLLPQLLDFAAKRPMPLFRNGQAAIDLTYVDDVCGAVAKALIATSDCAGEIYNISSGECVSVREIVEKACAKHGITPKWRDLPFGIVSKTVGVWERLAEYRLAPKPPVTRYLLGLFAFRQSLNISKAARDLGWTPQTSFDAGLAHLAEEGQTS